MAVIRVKITYCSLFERERRHPIFVEQARLAAEENLRRPRKKLAGANQSKDVYQTFVSNFHETPQAQAPPAPGDARSHRFEDVTLLLPLTALPSLRIRCLPTLIIHTVNRFSPIF